MAKSSSGKGGGPAKVRFILFEAEVPDGGLSELAQVLQNALRPTHAIQHRPAPPLIPGAGLTGSTGLPLEEAESDEEPTTDVYNVPETAPRKPREQRQRRVVSPEVVTDLDLNTDPSWLEFAGQANPSVEIDKFLVVAEWCKRHRGIREISANHVFTCFKRIQWSTNKADFGSTLRACKHRKFMGSGTERSFYVINHLGSSRVDDLIKK